MHNFTFPNAKILVIDDEPSNVRLLERILDLAGGFTYRCTTDPREAVSLFAEFQPDLVLTDLHMPHVDGYQLMEQLRQLIPEDSFLPIVVLTADITAETRRRALGTGASDFITKPLDTTEVQLRIRNLLENRFLNLRLEEQVRRRTRELEHALEQLSATQEQVVKQERLRALGMMAGGIAHDFNNALTMMLGYGELLLPWVSRIAPGSKEQGYIANIVTAAQDAAHVVSRLRDFYRPTEKGDVRLPIEIAQLCRQAVDFTAPKWNIHARSRGVQIEVKLDLTEGLYVMGSAPELREVLTNLIFNSVDAMPNGGTITVRTRALPEHVRVEVVDTGFGMTAEERDKCLEPFYTTKGERGTGLGLAVAYGIIQRHDGTIEIESEKGEGTAFSLVLPAGTVGTDAAAAPDATSVARSLRVLVVDDQEIICELICEHLRADGHEADSISEPHLALEKMRACKFDLVITDQSMPGMTGEQLARGLKAEFPALPVILLTGFGEEIKAQGKLPEGIDLVVGKPVTSADLRRAIMDVAK